MTLQEIFDKVAVHLLKQGKKSMNSTGCAYHSPFGLRCAVGCLIPDELYDPVIEGAAVSQLFNSPSRVALISILRRIGITDDLARPLGELQDIHDAYDVDHWGPKLRTFALKYGLSLDALGG